MFWIHFQVAWIFVYQLFNCDSILVGGHLTYFWQLEVAVYWRLIYYVSHFSEVINVFFLTNQDKFPEVELF